MRTVAKWVGEDTLRDSFSKVGSLIDERTPINFSVLEGGSIGKAFEGAMNRQFDRTLGLEKEKLRQMEMAGGGGTAVSPLRPGVGPAEALAISKAQGDNGGTTGHIAPVRDTREGPLTRA